MCPFWSEPVADSGLCGTHLENCVAFGSDRCCVSTHRRPGSDGDRLESFTGRGIVASWERILGEFWPILSQNRQILSELLWPIAAFTSVSSITVYAVANLRPGSVYCLPIRFSATTAHPSRCHDPDLSFCTASIRTVADGLSQVLIGATEVSSGRIILSGAGLLTWLNLLGLSQFIEVHTQHGYGQFA